MKKSKFKIRAGKLSLVVKIFAVSAFVLGGLKSQTTEARSPAVYNGLIQNLNQSQTAIRNFQRAYTTWSQIAKNMIEQIKSTDKKKESLKTKIEKITQKKCVETHDTRGR